MQVEKLSNEAANAAALTWCNNNPGWQRFCDIADVEAFYKTWDDLSALEQKPWLERHGSVNGQAAWEELASRPCKVRFGYIDGFGRFYKKVTDVPELHNFMTVLEVG